MAENNVAPINTETAPASPNAGGLTRCFAVVGGEVVAGGLRAGCARKISRVVWPVGDWGTMTFRKQVGHSTT